MHNLDASLWVSCRHYYAASHAVIMRAVNFVEYSPLRDRSEEHHNLASVIPPQPQRLEQFLLLIRLLQTQPFLSSLTVVPFQRLMQAVALLAFGALCHERREQFCPGFEEYELLLRVIGMGLGVVFDRFALGAIVVAMPI